MNDDEILKLAIKIIIEHRSASTALLQRKLQIGYGRAAKIIDELEIRGIIRPMQCSSPRELLIDDIPN